MKHYKGKWWSVSTKHGNYRKRIRLSLLAPPPQTYLKFKKLKLNKTRWENLAKCTYTISDRAAGVGSDACMILTIGTFHFFQC